MPKKLVKITDLYLAATLHALFPVAKTVTEESGYLTFYFEKTPAVDSAIQDWDNGCLKINARKTFDSYRYLKKLKFRETK